MKITKKDKRRRIHVLSRVASLEFNTLIDCWTKWEKYVSCIENINTIIILTECVSFDIFYFFAINSQK